MSISPNSQCPCGSGKKFKKCCWRRPSFNSHDIAFSEIAVQQAQYAKQLQKEREIYGHVNPIVSTIYQGQQIVAVGNELHFSPKWKIFIDFLLDYVKKCFGKDWWLSQCAKKDENCHQIINWCKHAYAFLKEQQRDDDGIFHAVPDGVTQSYLNLAYDLYVLKHHLKLQQFLIDRLKNVDQFQGAKYELFVTATLIRAGFTIEFENERDPNSKHPEFVATHIQTKIQIDVEAKSRHRKGVLGFPGEREDPEGLKLGIRRKINEACEKIRNRPFAVFVDMNLPPERTEVSNASLIEELRIEFANIAIEQNGVLPFSFAVLTNYADYYHPYGKTDIMGMHYINEPGTYSKFPVFDKAIVDSIDKALQQYGQIPNQFDNVT